MPAVAYLCLGSSRAGPFCGCDCVASDCSRGTASTPGSSEPAHPPRPPPVRQWDLIPDSISISGSPDGRALEPRSIARTSHMPTFAYLEQTWSLFVGAGAWLGTVDPREWENQIRPIPVHHRLAGKFAAVCASMLLVGSLASSQSTDWRGSWGGGLGLSERPFGPAQFDPPDLARQRLR
jgi:hypothetical protein